MREGEELVWESEALVSNEDGNGGSVGDKFGDGIKVAADCCTESILWELSPVWWALLWSKLLGSV